MQTNRDYLLENPEVMVNAVNAKGDIYTALGICKWRNEQKTKCIKMACRNCAGEWLEAEHIEPDSLEKIIDDATTKTTDEYWGCVGILCENCPHEINPRDMYGVGTCTYAMSLDLLSRHEKVLGK